MEVNIPLHRPTISSFTAGGSQGVAGNNKARSNREGTTKIEEPWTTSAKLVAARIGEGSTPIHKIDSQANGDSIAFREQTALVHSGRRIPTMAVRFRETTSRRTPADVDCEAGVSRWGPAREIAARHDDDDAAAPAFIGDRDQVFATSTR